MLGSCSPVGRQVLGRWNGSNSHPAGEVPRLGPGDADVH